MKFNSKLPISIDMPSVLNHNPKNLHNTKMSQIQMGMSSARQPAIMDPKLHQSIIQNSRKVMGPSSIKSLIRSAATRDVPAKK